MGNVTLEPENCWWQISIILGILRQGIQQDHCLGHGEGPSSGPESPLVPGIGWQGRGHKGGHFVL